MNLQMYPVLRCGARCSLVAIAITYAFGGCSSGSQPVTVPLQATTLAHKECTRLPKTAAPSVVYVCKSDAGPVFVATLKDCSIPEKFTFQATTRQLLVGLVGAKVAYQASVNMGSFSTLQSVVTGTVDAEPVMMSTFTYRNGSCVTDLVLWQGVAVEELSQAERIDRFTESSKKLATALFNDYLEVQDVTPVEG